MMNKLLTVSTVLAAEAQELGGAFSPERWKYALQMTLMGMGAIFAVLTLLLLVLLLFKVFFARDSKKKAESAPKAAPVVSAPAPASAPAPVVAPAVQEDEVTVAVITAAIAAYRASENPDGASAGGFRVVSFHRAGNGRAWNSRK